jgi:hypothetical protein
LAYLLVWLALTAEIKGFVFQDLWETPLTPIGTALFNGLPGIHFYPWDLMVLAVLAVGLMQTRARKNRVGPLLTSIHLTLGSVAALWIWGLLRGGSVYQTMFQLHSFVMQFAVAYMLISTCQTAAAIRGIGTVVTFAALYRSMVLIIFYVHVVRHLPQEPASLSDHADSALFASGIVILVAYAVERRSMTAGLWALLGAIPICAAIELNNRRIAWLEVVAGLALIYVLQPKSKLKRQINRVLVALSPLILAYVAAGWGNPVGIFKPVGSISTMFGEHEDTSSIMRDIENYNLLQTLKTNPLLGTGWGHEYIEQVKAYDISSIFPQYRYKPHNSVLGVLAFTGMIGFAGTWQFVPVASFFHARVQQTAKAPLARAAALAGLLVFVVCVIQAWGDLGFDSLLVNVLMGTSLAVAGRMPILVAAWPGATPSQPRHHV